MKKYIIISLVVLISMVFSFAFIYLKSTITNNDNTIIGVIDQIEGTMPDNPVEYIQNELKNKDIKGILEIPGTDYKTVVMQSKDNNYYLRKGVDKKYSRGGTPFLDYRVNIDESKKLLIYGHNSKYMDMPFKILQNYHDKEYYNNHKYLILTSTKKRYKYEIFSIYVEPSDWSYLDVKFKNKYKYYKHLQMLKNNSIFDTGVEISKEDDILILQTCSTKKEYQKYQKKFLLIVAKKVEELDI